MKKYMLLLAVALFLCCPIVQGADFGDLLKRLDSRDFSAEKDVVTGRGGVYVGETVNPHEDTVMFKARAEFAGLMSEARKSPAKTAELKTFILDGVKQNISVETKVWLLWQLGYIGEASEVPALTGILTGKEQRCIDAAAAALANIPGDEALKALKDNAKIPAAAAALTFRLAPVPAMTPVESIMPLGIANAPKDKVDQWLKGYDKLSEGEKIRTLAGLTERNDKQYRPYALAALKSDSEQLQKAGFLALEKMAQKEDVDLLLANLEKDRDLTIRILGFIVADGFDEALQDRLDQAKDSKKFLDLAAILTNRAVDIRANVFKRTTAADCADRLTLLRMVVKISTADDVPQLVASAMLIPRGKEHDDAENLIAALCNKNAEPIIKLLNKYPAPILYPMMCRTGGTAAQTELSRALDSSDPALRELGVRSLAAWSDATMADKMLAMLKPGVCSDSQFTSILRAYIRVMSLPSGKDGTNLNRDQKLDNLKNAYTLAKRLDEKKLILSRLAANRTVKSLQFALECAADAKVAPAAYNAIAEHAHDTALRKQYPEIVLKAINLVIENSKDQKLIDRVKVYKGRME